MEKWQMQQGTLATKLQQKEGRNKMSMTFSLGEVYAISAITMLIGFLVGAVIGAALVAAKDNAKEEEDCQDEG